MLQVLRNLQTEAEALYRAIRRLSLKNHRLKKVKVLGSLAFFEVQEVCSNLCVIEDVPSGGKSLG